MIYNFLGIKVSKLVLPGNVWSFRIVDRNTDNWAATVNGDSPAFLATFVEDGLYDIGALSGDITYEFVVKSNPDGHLYLLLLLSYFSM